MSQEDIWTLAGVLVLLVVSALLSLAETAFTATSKARILSIEHGGDKRAALVSKLLQRREQVIAALLLGNNVINILATALTSSVFLTLFDDDVGVLYATAVMTVLIVIFGEIMPKTYGLTRPEGSTLFLGWMIRAVTFVLGPFARAAEWVAQKSLGTFGIIMSAAESIVDPHDEIRGAVNLLHMEGGVARADRDMLGGLLDLRELTVSDIMIHRTKMNAIDADAPIGDIVEAALESAYTRLPLWRSEPENIIGVLHVKNLVRAFHAAQDEDKINIDEIMSPAWFVPDSTSLEDQLRSFLKRKAHIALVVDEYGEVMGLVTLEDIIEEIVGDISDETDHDIQGLRHLPDGVVVADGQVAIRDINRAMNWNLPDEEATTLAGLVIHEARMIPELGQAFTFYGYKFEVIRRERNRLTRLRITPTVEAKKTT